MKSLLLTPTSFIKYPLQDVQKPNLLREIFPYDEIPRIEFDHRIVPICPAQEMFITDTSFRDGQQAQPPYTVNQIVDIFRLLHRLGGPKGIIRQSEFFLYSQRDKEAVEKCLELNYEFPQITGWIRAVKKDFQLVKEMGLRETGILTSASDYHIFLKLNKTRKEAMEEYLSVVKAALDAGIIPRCHLEDITRADFYGFVIPFVQALMELSQQSGIPIKVRACDTMGYGITYPGATLPRSVPKLIYNLIHKGGVPSSQLEWHGHNDFHKVIINASTAWLYGASGANGTLLGFGERTGNPPIEALIIEYIGLKGTTDGIDTTIITEISDYFKKELALHIPHNYPFVGLEFNTTQAGIHADGLIKNEEIYNIFNTKKILNRPIKITINEKSGLAGIAHWVNEYLRLTGNTRIDKRHPGIVRINKWISEQYEEGRITSISSEEMLNEAKKHLSEYFKSDFDLLKSNAYEMACCLVEELVEKDTIKSMNTKLQEPEMEEFLQENPFIQFIYIVDLNGRKITKNITRVVDRALYDDFGEDEDFSDREWFIDPLRDGKTYITDFYSSKITNRLCITVSTPIRNIEEEITGILGVDIMFEDLARLEEIEEVE